MTLTSNFIRTYPAVLQIKLGDRWETRPPAYVCMLGVSCKECVISCLLWAKCSLFVLKHLLHTGWFRGKVNILGSDSTGRCEKTRSYKHLSNSEWLPDRAVWISRPNSVRFLFVGLDKERRLQKKCGYTGRNPRLHCGCCCPHKERRRSAQTKNTRSSRTSCKVHWGWLWDFS